MTLLLTINGSWFWSYWTSSIQHASVIWFQIGWLLSWTCWKWRVSVLAFCLQTYACVAYCRLNSKQTNKIYSRFGVYCLKLSNVITSIYDFGIRRVVALYKRIKCFGWAYDASSRQAYQISDEGHQRDSKKLKIAPELNHFQLQIPRFS